MFTGIVKDIGIVEHIESKSGLLEFTVSANLKELDIGKSISVDGCCLTITQIRADCSDRLLFSVQVTEETIKRANLFKLKAGSKVNLEPSLKLGDSVDGHLVTGHVDAVGEINNLLKKEENTDIEILFPKELKKFMSSKGSIAVNGVSLTVIDIKNNTFNFTLIPYTRDNTNLGLLRIGDLVNLEVDVAARYFVNYMEGIKQSIENKI